MKTSKRVLCIAILVALTLSLCAVTATADTMSQSAQKWNIMLVIDGSGSLDHTTSNPTDKDGLRYYAVANFLGTLNEENVQVGAIVFTASIDSDPAKIEEGCIKVNTHLMPLSGPNTKETIMRKIDPDVAFSVEDDNEWRKSHPNTEPPQTDIGTALLAAYKELASAPDEGQKSAIFLFTDGQTEVLPVLQGTSKENGEKAIEGIRQSNYILCGIFLNGADAKNTELSDMVWNANGTLQDRYIEIKEARHCIDATDMFLRAMGYSIEDRSEVFTTSQTRTFLVPGFGIREATIRIYTVNGNALPADLNVRFEKPNHEMIEGPAADALCYSFRRESKDAKGPTEPISRVYKLKNPDAGLWTVYVDVPDGNVIEMRYSPSFNVEEVSAELDCIPAVGSIPAGTDVEFHAYLSQGARLTDPDKYQYYTCTLVYQFENGPEQSVEMALSQNDGFVATLNIKDYGVYTLRAKFSAQELTEESNTLTINLVNNPPKTQGVPELNLTHGIFQPKETEIDLSPYASDQEDGQNLTFQLYSANTCDADSIVALSADGSDLKLLNDTVGSGTLHFEVYDQDGGHATLLVTVKNRNMTPVILLCIGAALLLLALAAVLIIRYINRIPEGRCTLSFHMGDQLFELEPPVPGTGATKRKTNMLAIVDSVVRPDSDRIDSSQIDEVRAFVDQFAGELRAIKVKTATGKVKTDFSGKKEKTGMLRVTGKGLNVKLYNRSVRLVEGLFEFGFYPPEDNNDFDDSYGSGMEEGGNRYTEDASYGSYEDAGSYGGASGGSYGGSSGGYGSYGDYDEGTRRAFNSGNSGNSGGYGGYGGASGGSSGGYGDYDEGTTGAFSGYGNPGASGGASGNYGGYDEGTTGAFSGYGNPGNPGAYGGYNEGTTGAFGGYGDASGNYGDYDEGTTSAFTPRR